MTAKLAAGEFDRKARMVLRLIAKPDARLVEATPGVKATPGDWTIETGKRRGRSRHTVEDTMVRELVDRGWLMREPTGGLRISAAGERWLAGTGEGEKRDEGQRFGDQHRLVRHPTRPARRSGAGPVVNEAESPLGWLRSRRDKSGEPLISEAQYEAGERLRVDFTVGQLSPRVTMSWDACIAPGSMVAPAADPTACR